MGHDLTATMIELDGNGGDRIEAYVARPDADGRRGGVVVVHHMPGFDRETKEIVRRFAELGYDAIAPNLHFREAPGAACDDAAAANRAAGGVPDDRLVGDVDATATYLRALPTSNAKVATIGFCSGGRQSLLAACHLDLQAAVDCYGAFVTEPTPDGFPIAVTNLVDQVPNLRCPLLGLFGNDDQHPAPSDVDDLQALLEQHGKSFDFHRYDNAGHAFFAVNRPSYRVAAANEGWDAVTAFFATHL